MPRHAVLVAFVASAVVTGALAEDKVIFPAEVFTDLGHVVHVEGTLTGPGLAYPNNHTSLTCYQDRHECIVINVESEGSLIFPLDLPGLLDTQIWTGGEIIANETSPCGPAPNSRLKNHWQKAALTTWIIDRTRKTADVMQSGCTTDTTDRFSIGDPDFWRTKR